MKLYPIFTIDCICNYECICYLLFGFSFWESKVFLLSFPLTHYTFIYSRVNSCITSNFLNYIPLQTLEIFTRATGNRWNIESHSHCLFFKVSMETTLETELIGALKVFGTLRCVGKLVNNVSLQRRKIKVQSCWVCILGGLSPFYNTFWQNDLDHIYWHIYASFLLVLLETTGQNFLSVCRIRSLFECFL